MCDYSLSEYPNRLARVNETLIAHKFPRGTVGFIEKGAPTNNSLVCAVCIPPGSELILSNISENIQNGFEVGSEEKVTFTQISMAVNIHRDAVQFENGLSVTLQRFTNERVKVLSLGETEEDGADPRAASTEADESEFVLVGAGVHAENRSNFHRGLLSLFNRW